MAEIVGSVELGVPVCRGVGVGSPVLRTSAVVELLVNHDSEAVGGIILTFNIPGTSVLT